METELVELKNLFEPSFLEELESKSKVMSIKAGDKIIDYGKTIRVIPIILKGLVKVTRMDDEGRELLLYYLGPTESCAMPFSCCMMIKTSEVRAVAEEDTELLAIPVMLLDEWMVKYSTWKSFIMKTVMGKFNELLKTIDMIAFQKLDERLVAYLKEKSEKTGSSLINLSHQQIADELATSRVVISRLLKKLENDNRLLLYRNQIKLLRDM